MGMSRRLEGANYWSVFKKRLFTFMFVHFCFLSLHTHYVKSQNVGTVSASNIDATTSNLVNELHVLVPPVIGNENARIQRKAIEEEKDGVALQMALSEKAVSMNKLVEDQTSQLTVKNNRDLYPQLIKKLQWKLTHHKPVEFSDATENVQSSKLLRGAVMDGNMVLPEMGT